ncbi:MAG: T9SS type A sorting domain-containing protein [Saprospiraceae bacterium]|nr:T9SS type A sorting domain-containing protein [Saprospiraceae bacterium]
MKTHLLIALFFTFSFFKINAQLIFMEDFENYNQGPISAQNGNWSDLSNATADVTYNGDAYMACTSNDVNQAFLNFVSGDFIQIERSTTTSGTQILVEVKIFAIDGFFIKFFGNDNDFYIYSNNDYTSDEIYLQFSMNFFYNQMQVYENGVFVGAFVIPDYITNLESVTLANEAGDFKLGCISLWDTTDNDADGYLASDDCDDNNPEVNPGAPEIPYNGLDDDCNPDTRDNDLDLDGYNSPVDCDDSNVNVNPGATEIPYNGIDDDCNPNTRDNDFDFDGYNFPADCDDSNANINPGEAEIPYNGIDDDCNPNTRDNDFDFDGYNFPDDCDDSNANINPGATEIPYNNIDDDCSSDTRDNDLDLDGYNFPADCDDSNANINPGETEIPYNGIDDDCNPNTRENDIDLDGYNYPNDCDDNNANINPGKTEIPYNGVDDDCNPNTRENDIDLDGYNYPNDCDDNNANINPGKTEIPYNGVDDDCNPNTRENDLDEDGFDFPEDCNDSNFDINPNAIEIPNNQVDENCDGILGTSTSTNEEKNSIKISIYPNPTCDYIKVISDIDFEYIQIYNSVGQLMKYSTEKNINVSTLNNNMYTILLIDQSGKAFQKIFIKQ